MDQSPYNPGVTGSDTDLGRPPPSQFPGYRGPPARIRRWSVVVGIAVVVLILASLIMTNGDSATPGSSGPPASPTASSQ
jgi:hypothetical protein